LLVVVGFRSSEHLASAYGIAVSGTMLITTLLLYRVMTVRWQWPGPVAIGLTAMFGIADFAFFAANAMKFFDGGWLPLALGGVMVALMLAWRVGTTAVQTRLRDNGMPFDTFMANLDTMLVTRLPGCGVFITRLTDSASPMLLHHIRHNRVLHENVILLTVEPTKRPRVPASERLAITELGNGFHRVVVKIGFLQRPDIPTALRSCAKLGMEFCREEIHYYIAHESLVRRASRSRLPGLVWILFNLMHRLGLRAADYFHLPPKRVIEVGFRVEV
jgi:KUP system potassium uptake protein